MTRLRPRFFLLMFLLVVVGATSGCRHHVRFTPHSPYPTQVSWREPLVIVVPDDLITEKIIVRGRGSWFLNDRYHVHWGQAMMSEASAHYSRMFGDVVLMTHSSYAEATRPAGSPATGTGGDTTGRMQSGSATTDFVPRFVLENEGFLLRIENARYAFDGRRGQIAAEISFHDRRTNNVLTEGRVTASGTAMMASESASLVTEHLRRATVSACSALFLQVRERMRQSVESPGATRAAAP